MSLSTGPGPEPQRPGTTRRPRIVLMCHHDAAIDRTGLAAWIASFADLAGLVIIEETADQVKRRIARELDRVGRLRFLDIVAFRLWYRLRHAASDAAWSAAETERLSQRYDQPPSHVATHVTAKPSSPEVEAFVRSLAPDIIIARSKFMLNKRIYALARAATVVLHPGVCPEYRNAHGAFWALAESERDKVGLTLLAVDDGIDTGPVYGYYAYAFDERAESHIRIQLRCLTENLDAIAAKLVEIDAGTAKPIDTTGRRSAVWGQPWFSRHITIMRRARARANTISNEPRIL